MYKMLVIGGSAGSFEVVKKILHSFPEHYPLPVAVVLHLAADYHSHLAQLLQPFCCLPVADVCDKQEIQAGCVYLAPTDYHLLIEKNTRPPLHFSLSVDEPVRSVRPSIDVLFQTAAEVYESELIAVLLSGANSDGAAGMTSVKRLGGLTIVQAPETSEFSRMPEAALLATEVDYVVAVDELIRLLRAVDSPAYAITKTGA